MNVKRMMSKRLLAMMLVLVMCLASTTMVFAEPAPGPQKAMMYWENTGQKYSYTQYELYKQDEQRTVKRTETYTTKVSASSQSEAESKASASAKAGADVKVVSVSASATGSTSTTTSGSLEMEWAVSITIEKSWIEYYDVYREYKYTYYIGVLKDTNGKIYDYDYTYKLISKEYTGNFYNQ